MLAPLVDRYWDAPNMATLAELRLNEERLGATVRDGQSLRMAFKANEIEEDWRTNTGHQSDHEQRYRRAYCSDSVTRLPQAFHQD